MSKSIDEKSRHYSIQTQKINDLTWEVLDLKQKVSYLEKENKSLLHHK